MFELYKNYDFTTVSSVIGLEHKNVTILNIINYTAALTKDPNLDTINSQVCVDRNIPITDMSKDTFVEFRDNITNEKHIFSLQWINIQSIVLASDKTTLDITVTDLSAEEADLVAQYVYGLKMGIVNITKR